MVQILKLSFDNDKSIYLQIAESIENDILGGAIGEEEQLPSTNQMSVLFKINPATAGKGINLLVEEGIVYKKRGIGMFVAAGAREKIKTKRKKSFYTDYVVSLIKEAQALGITNDELATMISKGVSSNE